jgi:nucleoside-diphosphate-sugar epimerase
MLALNTVPIERGYSILWPVLIKQKLLGYDPKFSLQAGLEEAIDWYWNNLK